MLRGCAAHTMRMIRLVDGDMLRPAAHYGPFAALAGRERLSSSEVADGRAVLDRQTIHVHDIAAECEAEFPECQGAP